MKEGKFHEGNHLNEGRKVPWRKSFKQIIEITNFQHDFLIKLHIERASLIDPKICNPIKNFQRES